MTAAMMRGTAWVTVRWECHCGRWALWKATPEEMEQHGLDPLGASGGRPITQIGLPPASAFEVLGTPKFACACGRRVPVIQSFAALLRTTGPIFWEAHDAGPPTSSPRAGSRWS